MLTLYFIHLQYHICYNHPSDQFDRSLHAFNELLQWCMENEMPSFSLLYRMLVIAIVGASDAWRGIREPRKKLRIHIIIIIIGVDLTVPITLTQSCLRGWIVLYSLMIYVRLLISYSLLLLRTKKIMNRL